MGVSVCSGRDRAPARYLKHGGVIHSDGRHGRGVSIVEVHGHYGQALAALEAARLRAQATPLPGSQQPSLLRIRVDTRGTHSKMPSRGRAHSLVLLVLVMCGLSRDAGACWRRAARHQWRHRKAIVPRRACRARQRCRGRTVSRLGEVRWW